MFEGVLITDTFVLGWQRDADRLIFVVEASLWPPHPDYQAPLPGEWTCYKRARIFFKGVTSVEGLPDMALVNLSIDPDGSKDFGTLSGLVAEDDGFRISGDFGDVLVKADLVTLEVNPD